MEVDDIERINIKKIEFGENRLGMACHDVFDADGTHVCVAHNAGFPEHASLFIAGNEVSLCELKQIVEFLETGIS